MEVLKHKADLVQPELGKGIVRQAPNLNAFNLHGAGIRPENSRDHAEHRGLAATGWADDVQDLAEERLEVHVLDRMGLGGAFA